ncbi:MAG: single-stranded DNA-binding protein [Gemmatimonas sp.]
MASAVRLETVTGREAEISKATLTAISNSRRGSGESREDEPTAIQWTLWGKQAEFAAQYLVQGSHVNVCGRLRNNHYKDASGNTVFGFTFTCEEIDYLDSRAEGEARKARQAGEEGGAAQGEAPSKVSAAAPSGASNGRGRKAGKATKSQLQADDDVPF